jgi:hypothetical protein
MSLSILAVTVSVATFAVVVVVEAAWRQRHENAERERFEHALTAAQRQRWLHFEAAGGAWREFADLLAAERKASARLTTPQHARASQEGQERVPQQLVMNSDAQ